jgi:hypothetical protein
MANENNWVKILINKLGLTSTADFCRKTDLGRGLVDKLSAGDNQPRFDTLQKIKNAFPQTNMNWLISGQGYVLEDVQDDDEMKFLELFRAKIKSEGNPRTIEKFFVSVDYFVKDKREMDELENNAKAQLTKDNELLFSRMDLLFLQYRRHIISDSLKRVPKSDPLYTGIKEKYSDLLDDHKNQILKTINLIKEDAENITEETEQDVASETSLNEDLSDDEGREWSELLEYEGEAGEFNIDDKE